MAGLIPPDSLVGMKGKKMENETTVESAPSTAQLEAQVHQLQEDVDRGRERIIALNERHDYNISNWRERLKTSEAKAEGRLQHLDNALKQAFGQEPKFDHTHEDVQRLLLGALRIAKLRGLLSDGNAIADALGGSELWGQVSDDDNFSGTGLDSNVIRERQSLEVRRTMEQITHHPRDPRFSEVWQNATRLAQEKDLCGEYDAIAREFDIPTDHQFEYEGYVTVRYSGYATIPVGGTATRAEIQDGDVAYGNIDGSDILEHIDSYDLEFEVDETDISLA